MSVPVHLMLLERASQALQWMAPPPVYVGGATVPIHLGDSHAIWARETDDVDCMVDVVSLYDIQTLEEALRCHGLRHAKDSRVMCRWLTEDGLQLDVMPTNGQWYGHTNTWLPVGTEHTFTVELPSGSAILVLNPEWLFAAKLEAYRDRGSDDPYMSKDLEDLVLLALGCAHLVERIRGAPLHLREWVAQESANILAGDVRAQTPGVFDYEDAMVVFEELARI